VKKEFAKIKARHDAETQSTYNPLEIASEEEKAPAPEPASLELHPDRQAQLTAPDATTQPTYPRKHHRQRQDPFAKETQTAQRQREEAEQKQKERDEANKQRQRKLEERERMRIAVAKARTPGRDGKRKLGRESGMLLEKVKRMVANEGG
jgi:hypothetical protein